MRIKRKRNRMSEKETERLYEGTPNDTFINRQRIPSDELNLHTNKTFVFENGPAFVNYLRPSPFAWQSSQFS